MIIIDYRTVCVIRLICCYSYQLHEVLLPILKRSYFLLSILRFKFFVYSAYFDDRVGGAGTPTGKNQGMVRIISATKTRGPERVWCRLWYRPQNGGNVTASVTVAAKVKVC